MSAEKIIEIIKLAGPFAGYAAAGIAIIALFRKRNIKSLHLGNLVKLETDSDSGGADDDEAARDASIVQHLEVRDYRNNLVTAFDIIKDDVRWRVRKNGWLERDDLYDYFQHAIDGHETFLTKYLDDHYYHNSKIERIALYDWNKMLWPQVESEYRAMYDRLLDIVKRGYAASNKKKAMLQGLQENRELCSPTLQRCPNAAEIIRLTTEILIDENLSMREQCMIEAEQSLEEIMRIYYSHYLKKYKQVFNEKK
jgi:hypothetical protein